MTCQSGFPVNSIRERCSWIRCDGIILRLAKALFFLLLVSPLSTNALLDMITLTSTQGIWPCLVSVDVLTTMKAPEIDVYNYALQGAFAGGARALSRAVTFPFDTVKTLEQSDSGTHRDEHLNTSKKLNYFKGVIPTTLTAIPANSLFFIVYNSLSIYLVHYTSLCYGPIDTAREVANELATKLVISSIATLPQNAIKIPFELVKQVGLITHLPSTHLLVPFFYSPSLICLHHPLLITFLLIPFP